MVCCKLLEQNVCINVQNNNDYMYIPTHMYMYARSKVNCIMIALYIFCSFIENKPPLLRSRSFDPVYRYPVKRRPV